MFNPACAASGLLAATIPRRPVTIERRELKSNDIGFIIYLSENKRQRSTQGCEKFNTELQRAEDTVNPFP